MLRRRVLNSGFAEHLRPGAYRTLFSRTISYLALALERGSTSSGNKLQYWCDARFETGNGLRLEQH